MLTTDGMGHDGGRNACSSDRHPDCTERPQGIYPPEHRAITLKCHLSGGQAPDHALNRAMGANTSSWRLLLVPLTAVLTASLLFLLGERSRLFPRQNMSISQQRPCQSTDGLGLQQEGAAASVTAGTGAAWRKVADGQQFGPGERSYYASWIDRDLSRWSETGITQQVCCLLPLLLEDGGLLLRMPPPASPCCVACQVHHACTCPVAAWHRGCLHTPLHAALCFASSSLFRWWSMRTRWPACAIRGPCACRSSTAHCGWRTPGRPQLATTLHQAGPVRRRHQQYRRDG